MTVGIFGVKYEKFRSEKHKEAYCLSHNEKRSIFARFDPTFAHFEIRPCFRKESRRFGLRHETFVCLRL